jgi:hypothetical protein
VLLGIGSSSWCFWVLGLATVGDLQSTYGGTGGYRAFDLIEVREMVLAGTCDLLCFPCINK